MGSCVLRETIRQGRLRFLFYTQLHIFWRALVTLKHPSKLAKLEHVTMYVLVRESPRAAGTELRFASKPCAGDKAAMDQWCAVLTCTPLRIMGHVGVLAAQGSRCTKSALCLPASGVPYLPRTVAPQVA